MYYLSKILPLLVLPIGITLTLMLAGILLRRRWLLVTAMVMLWLSSIPISGRPLVRASEGWAVRTAAADAPDADAIVVLSAGRLVAPGPAAISEWGDPDRFFGGIELYQAGKAPLLVFTGGWSPWQPDTATEGEILAGYAKALGVPPDRIAVTPRVFNTAEEAREVAAILRARPSGSRVLLVTSAFHIPRARQLFINAGLSVTAFPVDFAVSDGHGLNLLDFVPTAPALADSQDALRELYGRLYYRLKPW